MQRFRASSLAVLLMEPVNEYPDHEIQAVIQIQIECELTGTFQRGKAMTKAAKCSYRMQSLRLTKLVRSQYPQQQLHNLIPYALRLLLVRA